MDQTHPCFHLFRSFLKVKNADVEVGIFDIVKNFEDECDQFVAANLSEPMKTYLRCERNSWRLIRGIYMDKVRTSADGSWQLSDGNDMVVDDLAKRMSDKEVIDALFDRSPDARLMQLILDWLEQNETDDMKTLCDKLEFYSAGPHCWENTLYHLKNRQINPLAPGNFCSEMDPDAPLRTNQPLHDLDKEDENRLMKHILRFLRAGRLDVAKEMAEKLGYYWLAAALYGWVLFHDSNFHGGIDGEENFLAVNGNASRDLWKYACLKYSHMDDKNKSVYEAAVFGALSGNVRPSLSFLNHWTDQLWLLVRASLDCLIEQELSTSSALNVVTARSSTPIVLSSRSSVSLSEEFWDNLKGLPAIFREIEASGKIKSLSPEEECHYNIQKLIILGDLDGILDYMVNWIRRNSTETDTHPHMIRFFAYIVLFLSELGLVNTETRQSFKTSILEEHLKYLIEWKEIELVAFHVSNLPISLQIGTYAKLLQKVTDSRERQLSLQYAKEAKLDIEAITKTVVQAARDTSVIKQEPGFLLSSGITEADLLKIDSLDWLLIDKINHIELLLQSNAFLRHFVLLSKIDCAKKVLQKLPTDLIVGAMQECRRKIPNLKYSPQFNGAVQEHLCHISYIDALESFDGWLTFYTHSKPIKPKPSSSQRFTDKVAYQHSLEKYKSDLEEWKVFLARLAESVKEKILKVLSPTEGRWMQPILNEEVDQTREEEMLALRKEKIPQLIFVMHTVLHSSNLLRECLQIANLVASESLILYKEFAQDQLAVLLHKLRETSIALLDQGADFWG